MYGCRSLPAWWQGEAYGKGAVHRKCCAFPALLCSSPLSFPKQLCLQVAVQERDGVWRGVDKDSADPSREIPLFLDCGSSPRLFQGEAGCPPSKYLPLPGCGVG